MKPFYVYILQCADGSYYIGQTDDIEQRISQHWEGIAAQYTSTRRPIKPVFVQDFATRDEAVIAERQIKKWSRKKKESLIGSEWNNLKILAKKKFER